MNKDKAYSLQDLEKYLKDHEDEYSFVKPLGNGLYRIGHIIGNQRFLDSLEDEMRKQIKQLTTLDCIYYSSSNSC